MEYQELIDKFWRYNQKKSVGATCVAFYLFLLKICNDKKETSFKLSDGDIGKELCIARKTVKYVKEKLRNLGLIHYQYQNGLTTSYKIIFDYNTIIMDEKKVKKDKPKPIISEEKIEHSKTLFVPNALPIDKNIISNGNSKVKPKPEKSNKKLKENTEMSVTIEEVLKYLKTLEDYKTKYDKQIELKYFAWQQNGWKTLKPPYNPINNSNWQSHFRTAAFHMEREDDEKSLKNFNNFHVQTPRFNANIPIEKPKMKQL